jgi:hypothetical protein
MKIRILLLTITIWISYSAAAERTIPPTDSVRICGLIKNHKSFSLTELDTFPKTVIKDQIIYNHNGEIKDTLRGIIGIPLKTLLGSVDYIYDKPKMLNEFYFVLIASDGYKVVLSWNEIYNTETGNNFFIITQMGGKKLKDLEQRIMFISAAYLKAGRRYIKGLEKIEVKRIE